MPTLYCPECGYNLTGLSADTCPECGTGFDPGALEEEQRSIRATRGLWVEAVVTPLCAGFVAACILLALAFLFRVGFGRGAVLGLLLVGLVMHGSHLSQEITRVVSLKRGRVHTNWFFRAKWPLRIAVICMELMVAFGVLVLIIHLVSLVWVA